jgi:hypothetical protein
LRSSQTVAAISFWPPPISTGMTRALTAVTVHGSPVGRWMYVWSGEKAMKSETGSGFACAIAGCLPRAAFRPLRFGGSSGGVKGTPSFMTRS